MNVSSIVRDPMQDPLDQHPQLRHLFHQLNNQLGIILAHAELLEIKVEDEASRSRAAQIVSSVMDAMVTAREIRRQSEPAGV